MIVNGKKVSSVKIILNIVL